MRTELSLMLFPASMRGILIGIGGTKVRDVERIKDFLKNNPAYKWIPELPFGFNYWNKENIGQ